MLERIDNLPASVSGLRATGKVSRQDYEQVVLPMLDEARREGRRLRFLYEFGPEFEGFTPGAAWEDFRIGMRYLRLFERCAVVTNRDWMRNATRAAATVMPCPVRVFDLAGSQLAVEWLAAAPDTALTYQVLPDRGVVVVEPHGKLGPEDFDTLDAMTDAWIESGRGTVSGIVVHARQFPGWQNLGSLLRHLRFVREHHRQVRRVALAVDSTVAQIAPALVDHFVEAEIKQFDADDLEAAIVWAGARRAQPAPASTVEAGPKRL